MAQRIVADCRAREGDFFTPGVLRKPGSERSMYADSLSALLRYGCPQRQHHRLRAVDRRILEAEKKFQLLLVNAQHVKRVPGRKTDQKDSEWIGELLQHGLLRASFVPPVEIRQLRDLTRMRARIRQTLASFT